MKKLLSMAVLSVALFSTIGFAGDYTMAPDGTYVSGDDYTMTPDGGYVSGDD